MKCTKLIGLLFIIIMALFLVSCAEKDEQQKAEPEKMEIKQDQMMNQENYKPIETGIKHEEQQAPQTSQEHCEGEECREIVDINDEEKQSLYNQIDAVEDFANQILDRFDDVYDYLEDKKEQIHEGDYNDLKAEIDDYYDDVEADIDDVINALNSLHDDVDDATTATVEDLRGEILESRDTLLDLQDDIQDQLEEFYADINDAVDSDDADLFIQLIRFESINQEFEANFSTVVKNIGSENAGETDVHINVAIEGESVGSCTKYVALDTLEQETVSCAFNVKEYCDLLAQGEKDSLDVKVTAKIDTEGNVEEINEQNNNLEWQTKWTLQDLLEQQLRGLDIQ